MATPTISRQIESDDAMTEQELLSVHRGIFYPSLLNQDWDALSRLYAENYTLVRSDGTLLGKVAVLADLRGGSLVFKTIELTNERVRVAGSIGILTGESNSVAERDGIELSSKFRLVAIYIKTEGVIHLLHFQSTDIQNVG